MSENKQLFVNIKVCCNTHGQNLRRHYFTFMLSIFRMRKDIASMLLASTIITTKINSSPQGKIFQSMDQASYHTSLHKPLQVLPFPENPTLHLQL